MKTTLLLWLNVIILNLILVVPPLWQVYDEYPRPQEDGEVIAKRYDKPTTTRWKIPIYNGSQLLGYEYRDVLGDDSFWLRLEEADGRQIVIEVDSDTYHDYEIGEWFDAHPAPKFDLPV